MNLNPRLLLIVGVISVSFAAIFIRLADAPPLIIAMYRLTIASLLILPFTARRMARAARELTGRGLVLIIIAGVFLAAHFVLWITSLSYTSVASSVVLVTAHPIFVALASYLLWHEKLNRLSILGIIISMAGVFFISQGEFSWGSKVFLGNLLALVAGLLAASYLMVARAMRNQIDGISYVSSVYAVSAVILVAISLTTGQEFTGYSAGTYLMFVLLAVIPQLLGHSSFNLAARVIPVTIVSVSILGEPVGATLLGAVILGELPTFQEIIGGLIILSGIYFVIRGGRSWLGSSNQAALIDRR